MKTRIADFASCGNSRPRAWIVFALVAAIFCRATPVLAQNTGNASWQCQSIYQIITDRFFDGDPSNNNADGNYDPAGHGGASVHGGDFNGIEGKLDYIKSLGATAIWISPVILISRRISWLRRAGFLQG